MIESPAKFHGKLTSFTATEIFIFSGYSNESQSKNFLLYRNFSAHIFIIENANFTAAKILYNHVRYKPHRESRKNFYSGLNDKIIKFSLKI